MVVHSGDVRKDGPYEVGGDNISSLTMICYSGGKPNGRKKPQKSEQNREEKKRKEKGKSEQTREKLRIDKG